MGPGNGAGFVLLNVVALNLADKFLGRDDAGEGIPPEDQERIFERFYRRGSELRRETQGVGLGLAIARHVVQAHGGSIEVESSPGSGSRFIVRLPVLMEPDVSGAAGGEREEKARGEADSEAARSEKR
jgi:light-regulated signal transduction histidine kinase (bacteriophytochrome)